jgi:hypothetical protein
MFTYAITNRSGAKFKKMEREGLHVIFYKKKKFVTQSRTGLQIYEGHGDQLNRPGPMA